MKTLQTRSRENCAPCALPGCFNHRHGVSPYCQPHMRAVSAHGHPKGRNIPRHRYAREMRDVREVFRKHATHPALCASLEWAARWLESGDATGPGRELTRLAMTVTPREVIEEAAALWLASRRAPAWLPDDARLTFALASCVLRLAPCECMARGRYTRATRTTRQVIGEQIRSALGVFMHHVADEADRMAVAREDARRARATPFNQSKANP